MAFLPKKLLSYLEKILVFKTILNGYFIADRKIELLFPMNIFSD